jgi:(p)ppGpp synthase/HD superfamily hydrolase
MQKTLSEAIALAAVAHVGQVDKAGAAYITHPIRVMQRCAPHGVETQIAAVLHDTVEDTWVTLDLLRTMGFSDSVVSAVDALTRRKDAETYDDYVARCARHPIARLVKYADLDDNSDPARRFGSEHEKLLAKYARARAILERISAIESGR